MSRKLGGGVGVGGVDSGLRSIPLPVVIVPLSVTLSHWDFSSRQFKVSCFYLTFFFLKSSQYMVQNSHAKIFYWAYVNNVINNKH